MGPRARSLATTVAREAERACGGQSDRKTENRDVCVPLLPPAVRLCWREMGSVRRAFARGESPCLESTLQPRQTIVLCGPLRQQRRSSCIDPSARAQSDAGKQAAATRLPRYPNPAMWQGYTFWVSEAAPSWDAHTRARRFLADFTVCPMSRGCIWPLAVGNTLHVNRDLFDILSRKARYAREQAPPGAPSPAEPFGREGSAQLVEHDLARTLAHLGISLV
jgi:hypothetical protein